MVSSRSWKNSNFNRVLSLALCIGVAFLLLAGSAFAQTGATSVATADQVTFATQVGKAATFTIPNVGSATLGNVYRSMGVARQATGGDFFLYVELPSGFKFNTALGALGAAAPNVTLSVAGGGVISPTIFSGGQVNDTFVKYMVDVTTTFVTQPTVQVVTQGWVIKDTNATPALLTAGAALPIKVQTFDSNTGAEFDAGTAPTATWIKAANGITAALTATRAVIDVSSLSLRKNFVAGALLGTDTTTQDNDAAIAITIPANIWGNANAAFNTIVTDTYTLTLAGNLSGVASFVFSPAANTVTDAVTTAEVTAGSTVLTVPGTNASLPVNAIVAGAPAGATATIPLRINVDGLTVLTTRTLTVTVAQTMTGQTSTPPNSTLVAAGTTLTDWGINGSVMMANWANANTSYWKSRFYIFNATSVNNAQVFVRLFQIPISSNSTAPTTQIGATVALSKTLGAVSGMTIRLEDIITASGAADADLKGPDQSYNVAVEITVYAPQNNGFVTGGITGFAQTFNLAGTVFTGTAPLSKVQ